MIALKKKTNTIINVNLTFFSPFIFQGFILTMENKMKTITTLLGVVLLMSFVSALDLNAGECTTLDIQVEGEVTWNDVEGVYITQNGSEIEVCLDILFETGNIIIEFSNEQKEIIVNHYSGGGGGGGGITYRDRDVNKTIYQDKEVKVDVPGETITTPGQIIEKLPGGIVAILIVILLAGLVMAALYFIERAKRKGDELYEPRQPEEMQ